MFFKDVADELFSIDRGVPHTLGHLMVHPGPTIRRYIVERDARLTKPFRLVLICLAIVAACAHVTGFSDGFQSAFNTATTRPLDSSASAMRTALQTVTSHLDVMLVLCWVPAIGAGVQAMYKRVPLNYAEVFVFGLYTLPQMLAWQLPLLLTVAWTGTAPGWLLPLLTMAPVVLSAHGYFRPEGEPLWRAVMCAILVGFSLVVLMLGSVMGLLLWNMAAA